MILGSYRNPPYRSHRSPGGQSSPSLSPPPTQNQASATPSGSHSPKRKRTTDEIAATPSSNSLRIETVWSSDIPDIMTAGANSPRTKVAARLQDLDIRRAPATNGSLQSSSQSPRKRHKRNPGVRDERFTPQQQRGREVEIPDSASVLEIGETPQMHPSEGDDEEEDFPRREHHLTPPSSPPLSPTTSLTALRKSFGMSSRQDSLREKRMPSPPPPTPRAPPSSKQPEISSSFAPSLPHVDESLLDLSALTWQDNEITGHELDATSPDDDGEGINGIGFRPTPAMAYARSQKRRQQVEGWKAREAREARQRRIERRRGGGSSDSVVGGEAARRVVRFEGDG